MHMFNFKISMFGVLELREKDRSYLDIVNLNPQLFFSKVFFRSFLLKSFDKRNLQINLLGNIPLFVIACLFYVGTGMSLSENDINSV